MAIGVLPGLIEYEYFSMYDVATFANPKKIPVVDKLNEIINNMIVSDNSDDRAQVLIYGAPNNYRLDISAIGKNIPEDDYEDKRSCSGLKVYTIIDKNDPSKYKRLVDERGFISPIDNSQTSYVSVPLVYTGKELERKIDPFAYDTELSSSNYAPLYPPQWDVIRRNYPEYRAIVEAEITKRHASYSYKKMFYSEANNCWIKSGTSRVRGLVEYITDMYYDELMNAQKGVQTSYEDREQ